MIKCHLSRLMGERKLRVKDVSEATGIHRNAITLLYKETAVRVDVATIDALCALFSCTVAELFEFRPDSSAETAHEDANPRPGEYA